jgi:hypothetical protein
VRAISTSSTAESSPPEHSTATGPWIPGMRPRLSRAGGLRDRRATRW